MLKGIIGPEQGYLSIWGHMKALNITVCFNLEWGKTCHVTGNQVQGSILWTLGIQKMYMGTLGY